MTSINRYASLNIAEQMSKAFLMPASIWKRAAAFIVDLAIIDIILFAQFRGIFTGIIGNHVSFSDAIAALTASQDSLNALMKVGTYMTVLVLLYFTLLEWRIQQTPGKMLMGVFLMSDKKLGFWQVLLSNLTLVPFFPFVLLWVVDAAYVLFSRNNQRFMENVARVNLVEMKVVNYRQSEA